MPLIHLSRGYAAQVDDIDFERFGHLTWSADVQIATRDYEKVYAYRTPWTGKGNPRKKVYLHRAIVSPPSDRIVDHRDGDSLNCRRPNLRLATYRQNAQNVFRPSGTNTYRGVSRDRNRWRVRVTRGREDGTREYLVSESYEDEVTAARAYDRAVLRLFGAFAATNFPLTDYLPTIPARPIMPLSAIPF